MNSVSNPHTFRHYDYTEWRMFFGAIPTSNEERAEGFYFLDCKSLTNHHFANL